MDDNGVKCQPQLVSRISGPSTVSSKQIYQLQGTVSGTPPHPSCCRQRKESQPTNETKQDPLPMTHPWDDCIFTYINGWFSWDQCRQMYHGCYRLGESDSGWSSMGIFGDNLLYLNSFLMSVNRKRLRFSVCRFPKMPCFKTSSAAYSIPFSVRMFKKTSAFLKAHLKNKQIHVFF